MTSSLRPAGSTRRWRRLRAYVLGRDGERCQVVVDDAGRRCGAWANHVDHVVSRAQAVDGWVELPGGVGRVPVDSLANLRAACARHNLAKGAGDAARPAQAAPTTPSWRW